MCCNLKVSNINMDSLREMNEYSYQRKLEAAGYADGLPILCQDIPFDIDMLRIVGLQCQSGSCQTYATAFVTWLAGSHSSRIFRIEISIWVAVSSQAQS